MGNLDILLISDLPIYNISQNIGIKVLGETIKGYFHNGYNVHLVYPRLTEKNELIDNSDKIIDESFYVGFYFKISKIKYLSYISKIFFWIYFNYKVKKLVLKRFKEKNFDVVYGIGPLGNYLVTKTLKKRFNNSLKVARYLGVASAYERYLKWNKRFFAYPELLSYKLNPDVTILTNDGTKGNEFLNKINPDLKNLYFFRNGIDKTLFLQKTDQNYIREKYSLNQDIKAIITVSRLSKLKRIDRSINILKQLIKIDKSFRLFIIGNGSEKEKLQRMVSDLELNDFVFFVGALQHKELIKYYNSADLFFSFYDTSNIGNPLLEAMLTGNCIVTLDTGGTKDFIPENVGVVIKQTEFNKAHKVIYELLQNNDKIETFKNNAKVFAESNLKDWDERIQMEIETITKHLDS